MPPRREQTATSGGTRGVGLTRESIVDAALAEMDRQGVDAFSMRRLAAKLDVTVPALYWHFENKDALCLAVVERVRDELEAAPLSARTPVRRLEQHLRALRAHWRTHPSALRLSLRYPPSAVGAFVDQGVALIEEMGYSRPVAVDRHRALVWTVLGFVYVEQGVADSVHHRALDASGRRYEVNVAEQTTGPRAMLDTDELFGEVIGLALGGLASAAP